MRAILHACMHANTCAAFLPIPTTCVAGRPAHTAYVCACLLMSATVPTIVHEAYKAVGCAWDGAGTADPRDRNFGDLHTSHYNKRVMGLSQNPQMFSASEFKGLYFFGDVSSDSSRQPKKPRQSQPKPRQATPENSTVGLLRLIAPSSYQQDPSTLHTPKGRSNKNIPYLVCTTLVWLTAWLTAWSLAWPTQAWSLARSGKHDSCYNTRAYNDEACCCCDSRNVCCRN